MDTKYVSPYNTETTKYTGPLAVVNYEGGRIDGPNGEKHMHGEGKILYANGATYIGTLKNDMLHGKGRLTSADGAQEYDGEFVDDKRHGFATFRFEGGTYTGFYKDNKRHGKGKETDNSGNTFEGEFVDGDAVHGQMEYENGDVYVGGMKDDDRHGVGKFISCEHGVTQQGTWVDDEYQGP